MLTKPHCLRTVPVFLNPLGFLFCHVHVTEQAEFGQIHTGNRFPDSALVTDPSVIYFS